MDDRSIQKLFAERSLLKRLTRSFFEGRQYAEVDTPIVVLAPGTEVYLDYFSTTWTDRSGLSKKLFLRSSPELHMKMLLGSKDLPKIYQLGPCFRNGGDYTPLHHPEFFMLEWYGRGIGIEGLIEETISYFRETASKFFDATNSSPERLAGFLPETFERASMFELFRELVGVTLVDNDPDLARQVREQGVMSVLPTDDFETAYFKTLIERIEPFIASKKGFVVKGYPPSQAALAKVESGVASRFEIYLGRVELCNGFFEVTDAEENLCRMEEANKQRIHLGKDVLPVDHRFVRALEGVSEPVSGNALGFDRWLMCLQGKNTLDGAVGFRDVTHKGEGEYGEIHGG